MSVRTGVPVARGTLAPFGLSCGVCGNHALTGIVVTERPGEFTGRMVCKICGAHRVPGR